MNRSERRVSVDGPVHATAGVLGQADSGRGPVAIRQEGEVKMTFCLAAL